MKRILLQRALILIAFLTTTVASYGAVSFDADKTYLLKHTNSNLYLSLNTGTYSETNSVNATQLATEGMEFTITASGSGYTISTGSNYVGQSTAYNWNTDNSTATEWTIEEASTTGQYYIKGPNGYLGTDASTAGSYIYTNKGTGDAWQIVEAATPTCEVTYNYYYNGTKVSSYTVTAYQGGAYPDIAGLPYGVTATKPTGNVPASATTTHDLTCTEDGTIVFSTDYATATWYSWKMRSGYVRYASASSFPETSNNLMTGEYYWAFVGTPFGFKVINYAAGNGFYMTGRGTSGSGNNPFSFSNTATPTEFVAWPSPSNNVNGPMYFEVKNSSGEVVNDCNSSIGIWYNGAAAQKDTGSQITIAEVSLDDMVNEITSLFAADKTYVLRSASSTYLKLVDDDDTGNSSNTATAVAYADEPSVFTIAFDEGNNTYKFTDTNGHHIGIASIAWNVSNVSDFGWTITPVQGETNGYYISQSSNSNYLGNVNNTNVGTGIYTNQGSKILWYIEEYVAVDKTYNVNIVGAPSAITITIDGNTVIGNTYVTSKTLTTANVSASSVSGYTYSVSIEGTTITITYKEKEATDDIVYYIQNAAKGVYVSPTLTNAESFSEAGTFYRRNTGIGITYNGNTYDTFTLYSIESNAYVGLHSGASLASDGTSKFASNASEADALNFIYVDNDIIPVDAIGTEDSAGQLSWNWYGGVGVKGNIMGLYGATDGSSAWRFLQVVTYTIHVEGLAEGGGVTYNDIPYSTSFDAIEGLGASAVGCVSVNGYRGTVTFDSDTNTYTVTYATAQVENNPTTICEFLNRIGGTGTSNRIETIMDENLYTDAHDAFIITSKDGKPCIKGSSYSAITTGIGWYLNHHAKVNLAWNNGVSADLSVTTFPVPTSDEQHTCDADYRYYLNYCTYGYSMTAWTWERWEKEIDWMALHGINMPLQIIGLEQVWKKFLMEDCGYDETNAEAFVSGPAYTAWWGMNNLQGWGGDNPTDQSKGMTDNAWYNRQVELASKILARERALGMEPVLPGFSGMMPIGYTGAEGQGNWCGFQRPYILDPNNASFATKAAQYYTRLAEVMGTSKYYSMDPFHEGGSISSGAYADGYTAVYNAMNTNCGTDTKWIIQQWQWANYQSYSLTAVPAGRLIVLDLFSDGNPAFDSYNGYAPQEAVYCTIPNFGGRTGFFGRIPKMANNYFTYKAKYNNIKGIGSAPEAIEQTPVVYDLLFELPWLGSEPNTADWMKDYVAARYAGSNTNAVTAWEELRSSALNNTTTLQGPHEAIICSRPSLTVNKVSSWGGSNIFYDKDKMVDAAFNLLNMGTPTDALAAANYSYDLTDITRQALTDYSKTLLASINTNSTDTSSSEFTTRRDAFLQLILDIDRLLGTNTNFRLGKWTGEARAAAAEVQGATTATADWYELCNARQLISTWGDWGPSENAGLRDYSYREWQGMLKDYYYTRWKTWFDNGMQAPSSWFYHDWDWAHRLSWKYSDTSKSTTPLASTDAGYSYSATPEGNTYDVARELLNKYFTRKVKADGTISILYYLMDSDINDDPWTIPTQNLEDMSTIKDYSQYVNSITAKVNNGTVTTIYSASAAPSTLYLHTDTLNVEKNDEVVLTWAGNDGLRYCYVRVYLDSDGDGTFDTTPIVTIGTSGAQNANVANNSATFTVPATLATALTHVRIRFDSAWAIGAGPDSDIKRYVYEVPLCLPTPTALPGDVNGDGGFSISDACHLIGILLGNNDTTPGSHVLGNTTVTEEDLRALINKILGK